MYSGPSFLKYCMEGWSCSSMSSSFSSLTNTQNPPIALNVVKKHTASKDPASSSASSFRCKEFAPPHISKMEISKRFYAENRENHTLRTLRSSSTPETSHQLATRHKYPTRGGLIIKYGLYNAVSTIWANRNSCSGVNAEREAFGRKAPLREATCD